MKLYRFTVGHDEKFYPFENEKQAYEQRAKVDHTFTWLPVVIEEIKIDGYSITVTADKSIQGTIEPSHSVHDMNREQLKQWLTEHNIEFTPQWGEQKLRELALSHV